LKAVAGCSSVSCNSLAHGWVSGTGECQRYSFSWPGTCVGGGFCRTQAACRDIASRETAVRCGEASCRNETACVNMQPVPSLADACLDDPLQANAACASIRCVDYVRGWSGNKCVKFASDVPGRCSTESRCVTQQDPACLTAAPPSAGDGAPVFQCGSSQCRKSCRAFVYANSLKLSDVCYQNEVQPACIKISCTALYAGFEQGACLVYGEDVDGACDVNGECAKIDMQRVASAGSVQHSTRQWCATAKTQPLVKCNDVNCVRSDSCPAQALQASRASSIELTARHCFVNAASRDCLPVVCTGLVKGWSGATCERFSTNSGGYCDGDTKCIKDCTAVPQQGAQPIISCGSAVNYVCVFR
jgi:hypothetical protein